MPTIHEWYGYLATDTSPAATAAVLAKACPIVGGTCTKPGGVCSVEPSPGVKTAVCPVRLHFGPFQLLREIAGLAFADFAPAVAPDGFPVLVPASSARAVAAASGTSQVGVFGKGWGGEVRLPPVYPDGPRYASDFILVVVEPGGALRGIVPVEVQTIDISGSYGASLASLQAGGGSISSKFGMNWENVNKRILPQLIVKGLMLQGEALCKSGIFFLAPEPVYDRIMLRLGGAQRFREIPRQPGSISFVRLRYGAPPAPGDVATLTAQPILTISTSDVSLGFITPENLPPAGSYEAIVEAKL